MLEPRPDELAMAITPPVALESPLSREFNSARIESRRLFSEFLGTFLLVLVGAGGAVVDAASGGSSAGPRASRRPVCWSWRSSCSWERCREPT
jgi:hypothetical protein